MKVNLLAVMQRHTTVVIDSGCSVRYWRDSVTKKYSRLPGIRVLHDFLALHDPGVNAVMKVCAKCYAGTVKSTPTKITKRLSARD